jgi:hypothetical protein
MAIIKLRGSCLFSKRLSPSYILWLGDCSDFHWHTKPRRWYSNVCSNAASNTVLIQSEEAGLAYGHPETPTRGDTKTSSRFAGLDFSFCPLSKASFARSQNKNPLSFAERISCPGLDFLRTLRVLRRSKWWSYSKPLNAFGVSGIFIS